MTTRELALETFAFYSSDLTLRAVDGNHDSCVYSTNDGKHCAAGRLMTPKYLWFLSEHRLESNTVDMLADCAAPIELLPQYAGTSIESMRVAQHIHDDLLSSYCLAGNPITNKRDYEIDDSELHALVRAHPLFQLPLRTAWGE